MVQLHMLETLRIIVNTANSEFLNDATQWHILHFCCLNLTKAGKHKTPFSTLNLCCVSLLSYLFVLI